MYWWSEKRWKQGRTKNITSRENTAASLEFWKTLVHVEGNQVGLHTHWIFLCPTLQQKLVQTPTSKKSYNIRLKKGHITPHPVLAPILCFKKYTMQVVYFKKGTLQQLFKTCSYTYTTNIYINIFNN